jgi:hypothetical protein
MFGAVTTSISRHPGGIPKDSPAGRKRFARCVEGRRRQESPKSDWKAVERGWFLGDEAFKEELLAQMHQRRGDHYGQNYARPTWCTPSA